MRHFKKGILTLATTAAVFAPVGLASATPSTTANEPLIGIEFCTSDHGGNNSTCSDIGNTDTAVNVCPDVDLVELVALQFKSSGTTLTCTANGGKFEKK
jgi:hypothetical protein